MRAYNVLGESPNSALSTAVTTTYIPAAPSNLLATVVSATQISLSWTDNSTNESGFRIERSADGGVSWSLVTTVVANVKTYNNTGLTGATAYSYRVRAYNTTNEFSDISNVVAATTLPATPSGLTATALAGSQVRLNWADVAGESGYYIERSTDGTSWSRVGSANANTVTFTDIGLTAGTRYYYRIQAYNSTGNGAYSSTVNLLAIG
jgi:titin